jgi:hypothetical protein
LYTCHYPSICSEKSSAFLFVIFWRLENNPTFILPILPFLQCIYISNKGIPSEITNNPGKGNPVELIKTSDDIYILSEIINNPNIGIFLGLIQITQRDSLRTSKYLRYRFSLRNYKYMYFKDRDSLIKL